MVEEHDAPLDTTAPQPFQLRKIIHLNQRPADALLGRTHGVPQGDNPDRLTLSAGQGQPCFLACAPNPAGHHAGLQEHRVGTCLAQHTCRFNDRLFCSGRTGETRPHLLAQYPQIIISFAVAQDLIRNSPDDDGIKIRLGCSR